MDLEEGADTVLTLDMDLAIAPDLAHPRASSPALALQSDDGVSRFCIDQKCHLRNLNLQEMMM
jgi:hypothetical protein